MKPTYVTVSGNVTVSPEIRHGIDGFVEQILVPRQHCYIDPILDYAFSLVASVLNMSIMYELFVEGSGESKKFKRKLSFHTGANPEEANIIAVTTSFSNYDADKQYIEQYRNDDEFNARISSIPMPRYRFVRDNLVDYHFQRILTNIGPANGYILKGFSVLANSKRLMLFESERFNSPSPTLLYSMHIWPVYLSVPALMMTKFGLGKVFDKKAVTSDFFKYFISIPDQSVESINNRINTVRPYLDALRRAANK